VPCLGHNVVAGLPSTDLKSGTVQASRHAQVQWPLPSHDLLSFKATELMLQLLLLLLLEMSLAVVLLLVWEDLRTSRGRALCPRSHLHRL